MTIKVHPLYIIFSFILIYCGRIDECLLYFIVVLLHEMAHYMVARLLGYKLNHMVFMPYGIGIGGENVRFQNKHEIMIALAGPCMNFLLAIGTMALWWWVPIMYSYTKLFVTINLVLGIFNLLPFYPLDGGRVLYALTVFTKWAKKIDTLDTILTIGTSCILLINFIYSIFHEINFTLLFIALFLLASIGRYRKENLNYRLFTHIDPQPKKMEKILVYKDTKVQTMLDMLRCDRYYTFVIMDNEQQIIKEITQDQLIALSRQK